MDHVRHLAMLARVAEIGSIPAAARALGVAPDTVREGIAALEAWLGASLLEPASEPLLLTEAGEAVCRCSSLALARHGRGSGPALLDACRRLAANSLRVAVSPTLGEAVLGPGIIAVHETCPSLDIDTQVLRRPVGMRRAGLDLLLHTEPSDEPDTITRHLGTLRQGLYAAPGYLAEHGAPQRPGDLLQHCCLALQSAWAEQPDDVWRFARGRERCVIELSCRARAGDNEALTWLAADGAGIVRLALFAPRLFARGALVRLLPGWACLPDLPVYAVQRRSPVAPAPLAAFLDGVAASLAMFDLEGAALA